MRGSIFLRRPMIPDFRLGNVIGFGEPTNRATIGISQPGPNMPYSVTFCIGPPGLYAELCDNVLSQEYTSFRPAVDAINEYIGKAHKDCVATVSPN